MAGNRELQRGIAQARREYREQTERNLAQLERERNRLAQRLALVPPGDAVSRQALETAVAQLDEAAAGIRAARQALLGDAETGEEHTDGHGV